MLLSFEVSWIFHVENVIWVFILLSVRLSFPAYRVGRPLNPIQGYRHPNQRIYTYRLNECAEWYDLGWECGFYPHSMKEQYKRLQATEKILRRLNSNPCIKDRCEYSSDQLLTWWKLKYKWTLDREQKLPGMSKLDSWKVRQHNSRDEQNGAGLEMDWLNQKVK